MLPLFLLKSILWWSIRSWHGCQQACHTGLQHWVAYLVGILNYECPTKYTCACYRHSTARYNSVLSACDKGHRWQEAGAAERRHCFWRPEWPRWLTVPCLLSGWQRVKARPLVLAPYMEALPEVARVKTNRPNQKKTSNTKQKKQNTQNTQTNPRSTKQAKQNNRTNKENTPIKTTKKQSKQDKRNKRARNKTKKTKQHKANWKAKADQKAFCQSCGCSEKLCLIQMVTGPLAKGGVPSRSTCLPGTRRGGFRFFGFSAAYLKDERARSGKDKHGMCAGLRVQRACGLQPPIPPSLYPSTSPTFHPLTQRAQSFTASTFPPWIQYRFTCDVLGAETKKSRSGFQKNERLSMRLQCFR